MTLLSLNHDKCLCSQSLGRVSSSPVYDGTTNQVLLTYDDGGKCSDAWKWHSIIVFTCAESQLQVCYHLFQRGYVLSWFVGYLSVSRITVLKKL